MSAPVDVKIDRRSSRNWGAIQTPGDLEGDPGLEGGREATVIGLDTNIVCYYWLRSPLSSRRNARRKGFTGSCPRFGSEFRNASPRVCAMV